MSKFITGETLDLVQNLGIHHLHHNYFTSACLIKQHQLQTALREKFNIIVTILVDKTTEPKFTYEIDRYNPSTGDWYKKLTSKWLYRTYENALEYGLIEALQNIDIKTIRKLKLNTIEKIEVAQALEALGVDVIEAGFPISSPGDFKSVVEISKAITNPVICALGARRRYTPEGERGKGKS